MKSLGLFWGLGMVLQVGGCGTSAKEEGAADVIKKKELLCPRIGADRVEASSFRSDGKNDIVKVFARSSEPGGGPALVILSCKELDLNGDGRKDMLVYYDSRGRKLREEFDHDFDGVADMKSYYESGQLVRQELDVDFDGKPDLVEYYENGKRVRLEKLLSLPPALAPALAPAVAPALAPAVAPSGQGDGAASSAAAPAALASPPPPAGATEAPPTGNLNGSGGSAGPLAPHLVR